MLWLLQQLDIWESREEIRRREVEYLVYEIKN